MRDSLNIPREVSYDRSVGDSNKPAREDHVHGIEVEDWSFPSYSNGWGGGAGRELRYLKDPMGFVHLEGAIAGGTTTFNTVIATLPVGYRPSYLLFIPIVNSGGNFTYVRFHTNGQITTGAIGFTDPAYLGSIIFESNRDAYAT